jgi:hypothetical protein
MKLVPVVLFLFLFKSSVHQRWGRQRYFLGSTIFSGWEYGFGYEFGFGHEFVDQYFETKIFKRMPLIALIFYNILEPVQQKESLAIKKKNSFRFQMADP